MLNRLRMVAALAAAQNGMRPRIELADRVPHVGGPGCPAGRENLWSDEGPPWYECATASIAIGALTTGTQTFSPDVDTRIDWVAFNGGTLATAGNHARLNFNACGKQLIIALKDELQPGNIQFGANGGFRFPPIKVKNGQKVKWEVTLDAAEAAIVVPTIAFYGSQEPGCCG